MRFKSFIKASLAICIAAILVIAACGCEDLGEYEDTEQYYSSFGDIVLISGTTKEKKDYSVDKYFYNEESREDFLAGEDGSYQGVEHSDYVYMAIPFESNIDMDTLALFLQSKNNVAVYINVFLTDKIPEKWKSISDIEIKQEENTESSDEESKDESEENTGTPEYDDPDPATRIGTVVVHLEKEKWNSFVLDVFEINGEIHQSLQIKEDQYILLQIRNNSGVRIFDEEKQTYVDPQTGIELPKAEITMTNLLIRALEVSNGDETQGGE